MVSLGDFGFPWNCMFWPSKVKEIVISSHVELVYSVGKVVGRNVYEIHDTKSGETLNKN